MVTSNSLLSVWDNVVILNCMYILHTISYLDVVFGTFSPPPYWTPCSWRWWLLGQLPYAINNIDYVFAPIISADYVAILVENFIKDFKELYPERGPIPNPLYDTSSNMRMKWYTLFVTCCYLSTWCMSVHDPDISSEPSLVYAVWSKA